MRLLNHSFAPLIDSGFSGGSIDASISRRPAIERAAARNHASYSRLASTTRMRRSGRACRARHNISAARAFGQSSSASSTIRTPPSSSLSNRRAASSTVLSNSSSFSSLLRCTRMGGRAFTWNLPETCAAIRRSRIGTASTSPFPSTIDATVTNDRPLSAKQMIDHGRPLYVRLSRDQLVHPQEFAGGEKPVP